MNKVEHTNFLREIAKETGDKDTLDLIVKADIAFTLTEILKKLQNKGDD